MFIGVASSVILFAVWKLNTSLLAAFVKPSDDDSIIETIYRYRSQARGPRVVASVVVPGCPCCCAASKSTRAT